MFHGVGFAKDMYENLVR